MQRQSAAVRKTIRGQAAAIPPDSRHGPAVHPAARTNAGRMRRGPESLQSNTGALLVLDSNARPSPSNGIRLGRSASWSTGFVG